MRRIVALVGTGVAVAAGLVTLNIADGDSTTDRSSDASSDSANGSLASSDDQTRRGEFGSRRRTFTRAGISAADTAPVAKRPREKMPLIRKYVAADAVVRRAGRFAGSTWYFARGKRKRLNLCLIERTGSTTVACPVVPRHYKGGWSLYRQGDGKLQISTVVVPDGFARVRVTDGRAAQISSITNNLLWVAHRARVKLVLTGRGDGRLRQTLFYNVPQT